MPGQKPMAFLEEEGVPYRTIDHQPAYTAQEIAAETHIPGHALAKTVIVKLDGRLAMAVLPASDHVDLDALASAAGAKEAELASEEEFEDVFPDSELGAMPPFGNLYGLEVFAAGNLPADDEIAFNGGSLSQLVRIRYADFERLVRPKIAEFTAKA